MCFATLSGFLLHTTVVRAMVLAYALYEFVVHHLFICLVSFAQTHVQSSIYEHLMYPVIITWLSCVFQKNWYFRHLFFEISEPSNPASTRSPLGYPEGSAYHDGICKLFSFAMGMLLVYLLLVPSYI